MRILLKMKEGRCRIKSIIIPHFFGVYNCVLHFSDASIISWATVSTLASEVPVA